MVEACKVVGLPEPEYGADGLFVWITFKRPNAVENNSGQIGGQMGGQMSGQTTIEQVFALIKNNPNITRKQLVEKTGKASSFVQKCINKLKLEQRIQRIGSDRNGYWQIVELNK